MIEYSGSVVSENQEFIQRNINNYIKNHARRDQNFELHISCSRAIFKQ